jgi:hypothetical protein
LSDGLAGKVVCHQGGQSEFDLIDPTWWKERTDFCRLSSNLHIYAMVQKEREIETDTAGGGGNGDRDRERAKDSFLKLGVVVNAGEAETGPSLGLAGTVLGNLAKWMSPG